MPFHLLTLCDWRGYLSFGSLIIGVDATIQWRTAVVTDAAQYTDSQVKKQRWAASVHHHCSACLGAAYPMSGTRILSGIIVGVQSTACNHGPVLRGCMIMQSTTSPFDARNDSLSPIDCLHLYRPVTSCGSVLDLGPVITIGTGTDKRNDRDDRGREVDSTQVKPG